MKKNLVLLLLVTLSAFCKAQIVKPVAWNFTSKNTGSKDFVLTLTATIDNGWHLYSQFIASGGPVATSFTFTPSPDYELVGSVLEVSKAIKSYEKSFEMNIAYFTKKAVFTQKIKLKSKTATIKGSLEYMVCNDSQCLPPEQIEFSFDVKSNEGFESSGSTTVIESKKNAGNEVVKKVANTNSVEAKALSDTIATPQKDTALVAQIVPIKTEKESKSLWAIFITGLLGGFAAFFMPCIFPMLPFTVSYFTKSTEKRGNALKNAIFYGFSIIAIYVGLGLLVSIIFGADALNNLSTNGIFNFAFFLLLVVFAVSFLGAFEITLPTSWINKSDTQADKKGIVGIFFMATTLALVSFSCTGPIIGTLLVQAASMGQYLGPVAGMFGFSLALAIPFALFAMFPSWLKAMPKSGGWLNSIKVTLGFLELALSLKFLSNVDLAYHWEWLDREVFLALWIVIFGLLGLYLLGKLKLSHNSEIKGISAFRLMLAIITMSFTFYMIPGLWGAPLRSIAAFLPPQQTQDFDLYTSSLNRNNNEQQTRKYGDIFRAPLNLDAFFDYDEGLAFAKKVGKPVIIDFTGHACVNCRKMETNVWSSPKVMEYLKYKYILVQLYVDDKTVLDEIYTSKFSGKKINTIGKKWSDLQTFQYNTNSQPYYVLLSPDGKLLASPHGADYNVETFASFLEDGLNKLKEEKK